MRDDVGAIKRALADARDARSMSVALGAVRDLLHAEGLDPLETRPLLALMGALEDHASGKPHPLLLVDGNAGNSPHAADREFKAATVAVVEFIRQSGKTKGVAIRAVAEQLKAAGLDVPESRIRTWHHELTNRSEKQSQPMLDAFAAYRSALGTDPDEVAIRAALETLRTLMRTAV